jgi:hypothetical protein
MLMRLLELKEFIEEMAVANKERTFSETQWDGIAELTKVLGPAKITSQANISSPKRAAGPWFL